MDNRYYNYGCPAIMHDGRFITNYVRGRVVDQIIKHLNWINSSQDYKLFLQQNANLLMTKEREQLLKHFTCNINGQCIPTFDKAVSKVEFNCGCSKRYNFLPNENTTENMCYCKNNCDCLHETK